MPRTRNSPLPTQSSKTASGVVRGRRTGRRINAGQVAPNEDGIQNMEAFFDAQENVEDDDDEEEDKKPKAKTNQMKKRTPQTPKPKTPKRSVRMSVGGDDDSEDDIKEDQVAALTQQYIAKLKTTITSPSELSKVSTAPPTPAQEQEATRFADNDDDEEEENEDALLTQEEVVVTTQSATVEIRGNKPQVLDRVDSPEPSFPPMDLEDMGPPVHSDDDDNGFDMGPPDQDDDENDDDVPATEPEDQKPAAAESDTEDDEDDKEGSNINMVHDPETPASVRKKRAEEEKAAMQQKRGRKKKRRSDSDDDDDHQTPMRKSKKKKKRHVVFSPQGVPTANRSYKAVPVEDFVEESPEDEGPRRSRRAKCQPLAYWKNEKFEYGAHHETGVLGEAMGDMPIVVNVVKALPTPYKKREVTRPANSNKQENGHKEVKQSVSGEHSEAPFDTSKLRKKYKVIDGETAHIWDDSADDSADLKVVAYFDTMAASKLPVSSTRSKEDGKVVGKAAQAFNIPNDDSGNYAGYIMGNLRLPPKGVKDAESVGPCSQTFTVCDCQPKALEVAYGDPDLPEGTLDPESAQRFFLSPGDLFRVPPGNCYRLHNHSKATGALLTWTIIRPRHLTASS